MLDRYHGVGIFPVDMFIFLFFSALLGILNAHVLATVLKQPVLVASPIGNVTERIPYSIR